MMRAAKVGARSALLIAALMSGCYQSPQTDCSIPCGADDRCPSSFSCNHGFCSRGPVCEGDAAGGSADAGDASDAVDQASDGDLTDHEAAAVDGDPGDQDGPDLETETDVDSAIGGDGDTEPNPDLIGDADTGEGNGDRSPADTLPDGRLDGSGAFSPLDLPGLILWLDPERGITLEPFRWEDRSPLHNDAVAPNLAPMVVPAASGRPPAVQFSGMDQYLRLPNGMEDFTQGMTAFVAALPLPPLRATADDPDHPVRFFDFGAFYGSLNDDILLCRFGPMTTQLLFQVTDDKHNRYLLLNDLVSDNVVQLFQVVMSGGDPTHAAAVEIYKNDSFIADGVAQVPRVLLRGSNLIGRSNHLDNGVRINEDYRGRMGDIIIYNRRLTETERQAVQEYLLARWMPG